MLKLILLLFTTTVFLFSAENSNIYYGFNRINENINFNLNADLNFKNSFGDFKIKQEYYGNSYLPNKNINDNQKFMFNWEKKAFSNLSYTLKNETQYVGNNFNVSNNNNLLNFNLMPGMKYNFENDNYLIFYYGMDYHHQSEVLSNAPSYSTDFNYSFNFDEFIVSSKYDNYYTNRSLDRDYNTNNAELSLVKMNDNSTFNLYSNYNSIKNDFIRSVLDDEIQIENRLEDKVNLSLDMSYDLFENIKNEIRVNFIQTSRDNSYRDFDFNNPRSGIREVRNLNSYDLYSRFSYNFDNSFIRFAVQYKDEDLSNEALQKFEISPNDLINQQNNISLLDYKNSFTRFYFDNVIYLNNYNLLKSDFVFEVNRYDTPSKNENRDRDQLVIRYNQKYEHIFSSIFSGGVEIEGRFRHLVYLKKENSINNVKERSLKFSPYFNYKYKNFEMTPEFQIFVNFRSYDYEFLFQTIKSDIQRSLTIRDSVNYKLSNRFRLNVSYLVRYKETGLFSWDRFSQSVADEKLEFYTNSIFYYTQNDNYYGMGIRYYNLSLESQRNLGNLGNDSFFLKSISPVVDIGFRLNNRTSMKVFGWYEYQNIGNSSRIIPNLRLETLIDINK